MNALALAVVESDSVVVSMTRASAALAEAVTISQTKKILDVAAAAEVYAKRQHLSEEAERMAATVKVEALRKLGEMLQAAPKAKGVKGQFTGGSVVAPPAETAPTLAELGLTKKESAVAQRLAALPDEAFQQVRDGHLTVANAIAAVDAARPASKPSKKLSKADEKRLEELAAAQARGVSMLTTYARLTLTALRSQTEFTFDERELLDELLAVLQNVSEKV